ncbi:MAG: hypothetical protein NTU53_23250 [Planctomycetota bacterium]|nr:hypothetical protein [Planctomycetota bacterium]
MPPIDAKTKVVAALVALLIIVGAAGATLFILNQFDSRPKSEAIPDKLAGPAISKLIEELRGVEGAVLRVKAAANVPELNKAEPWRKEADEVMAKGEGFDYSVGAGTWKDNVGSTWHSWDNLEVTITCPKGFAGKVYVHLHDWNNQGRVADVRFAGRELGTLDSCAGAGVWLGIPVTAEDTAEGKVVLSVRPTHSNAHVDEIVLVALASRH